MQQPMITIIIPILNGEKYIRTCFDSIFAQTYKNFEVVVFDNDSNDRTLELAEKYPVKVIRNQNNIGWAKANNLCIGEAKTKYVFLLNIDTILDPDCIEHLFKFAESKDDFACASPAIVEYSAFLSGEKSNGYPLAFDIQDGLIKAYDADNYYTEVSFVPGTALFANRERLQKQFYFREDFFIYHEDVELNLRIITKTNLKMYFLSTAIVAHDSKQSFSRFSTCKLALRNLFTCLITYQDRKEFLSHYLVYGKNLFRMYKDFYYQYYPFAFPILSIFYLIISVFKLKKYKDINLNRLYEVNLKMSRLPKQFEFIF